MAGAILQARGLTNHLLPPAVAFKQPKFRPRDRAGILEKLEGFCPVVEEAVAIDNKNLDRLILARELMHRVTRECRANSKLPELAELFLSRPLVTVPLVVHARWISPT